LSFGSSTSSELLCHCGGNDETYTGSDVTENQRSTSTNAVQEDDTKYLTKETSDRVDGIDQKGVFGESDTGVDIAEWLVKVKEL
jgi:hypothetical protein